MKQLKHIWLFTFLVLCSCGHKTEIKDAKSFDWNDFGAPISLKGEILSVDSLMKPIRLWCSDSLLVTVDSHSENFVQIYSKNTGRKVCDNVPRGLGPNESLNCWSLQFCDDTVWAFDMQTGAVSGYDRDSFLTTSLVIPSRKVSFTEYAPTNVVALKSGMFVTTNLTNKTGLVDMFNSDGTIYPLHTVAFPQLTSESNRQITNRLFENRLYYQPDRDRIVVFYVYTDLIEIYDAQMNLIERIQGPDNFIPKMESVNVGDATFVRTVKNETKFAYLSGVLTHNYIYTLYYGIVPERGKHLQDRVLVFDYNGKPSRLYQLEYPCSHFCVDETDSTLYALSELPDPVIVKYKLN